VGECEGRLHRWDRASSLKRRTPDPLEISPNMTTDLEMTNSDSTRATIDRFVKPVRLPQSHQQRLVEKTRSVSKGDFTLKSLYRSACHVRYPSLGRILQGETHSDTIRALGSWSEDNSTVRRPFQ